MSTPETVDPGQLFPDEEFRRRLKSVRERMAALELDGLLVTVPENIFYLTGLSHQGYFALHLLIVPLTGEMQLIARAMERVTVNHQVTLARFQGYGDADDPVDTTYRTLERAGLGSSRLGLELRSNGLTPQRADELKSRLPRARWEDVSGLIDEVRLVQSPLELAYTRKAATVTAAMLSASVEAAGPGANEREIAAEAYKAMVLTGGEYPGFHPLIRSTSRLGEEHTTWQDHRLAEGDSLFLEMAGCAGRYHAPAGRLVFIGDAPAGTQEVAEICLQAFDDVVQSIVPGVEARHVYRAWQSRLDRAGLEDYRRHHCGYLVGIGFPPSWTGGNTVIGLRHDSRRNLLPGMVFHLMSWLMGTGRGDYFVSDTALLTETGCELLTTFPREPQIL